jgi:hypothetical protein
VPAWIWLAALVVVSAAVRLAIAKPQPAPWIFGDEMVYAHLAESIADGGGFAIRDSPGIHGYAPGYPLLIAPAYAIYDDLAHAYAAAKAINALVMSLAAVPVYFIARRLVTEPLALVAAGLSIGIPSFVYTGTIMTENAFYPAFALATLALFAALERPTLWRQLAAFGAVGLAFLVRTQAVTLMVAFLTAIILATLVEARADGRLRGRDLLRRLDTFRVTWIVLGAGLVLVLVAAVARGGSPVDALGGYSVLADQDYSVSSVARWFVLHAAELDLYLGILPFAALILLAVESFGRAEMPRALRLFGLLALSITVWMTLVVAATASYFASSAGAARIEERNLFHVAPLFLIALVVWLRRGLPRAWPAAGIAALIAGGLPGAIPYNELANLTALSDTVVFIPLWNLVFFGHIQSGSLPVLVTVGSLGTAVLFLLLPRRVALVPVALVFGWFVLIQVPLERQINATSHGVLAQGQSVRREWIDEAVGSRARVAALWTGGPSPMTVLQNEFFNRSVRPVYGIDGASPATGLLPQQSATVDPATGVLRTADGRPVRAAYALADNSLELSGLEVARDPATGLVLYRASDPVRVRIRTTGIYPDAWTGPEATYTVWGCRGGHLRATIASETGLFQARQTVVVSNGNGPVRMLRLAPGREKPLDVPLTPERGRCSVTLRVTPTAVPAQALGIPDSRALGVRLIHAEYVPRSG